MENLLIFQKAQCSEIAVTLVKIKIEKIKWLKQKIIELCFSTYHHRLSQTLKIC